MRKHRIWSGLIAVVLLACVAFAGRAGYRKAFAPPLNCGAGMTIEGWPHSCVGVSLDFTQFTAKDPAKLRKLEHQIGQLDRKVHGYYVSIVLLLDLSPVLSADTVTYASTYSDIEGAITAAWQANNTATFGTSPAVKLYLANMGSLYRSWRESVRQIIMNREAQHITSVVGLGQSTIQTRRAAALLGSAAHLPVIGATVTGDNMNRLPKTNRLNRYFFRVAPPNSDEVRAIADYVPKMVPKPATALVVEDYPGDAYESTLAQVAPEALRAAGLTVYKPLQYESGGAPAGESREDFLENVFDGMQSNLCQLDPSVVFFAGRGKDLHAFVKSWADERGCQGPGVPALRILSGDDAAEVVKDSTVGTAIRQGLVTVTYGALENPDMWGSQCDGAKVNYDEFLAAFTGKNEPCRALATAGSPRFSPADLDNGHAVPTHDAVLAAVKAARDAQGNLSVRTELAAVANPKSQLSWLINFRCTTMLGGADGYVDFGPDGNPRDHPVPIVALTGSGQVRFLDLTWPDGGPVLHLPARGGGCGL
jgi:ABC-type branched-subunit amino acid transport system substrate-binding protein